MGFLNSIFNKDKRLKHPADIPVTTDIHSHLVPGIDDGSETMQESLALIKSMKTLGYKKIITTPHIMGDYYKNTSAGITEGLNMLREAVDREGLDVIIEAACEYYIDDHFINLIKKDDLLTFGDRYILVETNTINYTEIVRKAFFELGLAGYKVVLAHPERYYYMWKNFDSYYEFHDMGILFQINIVSLAGYYSPNVKTTAERLIDAHLVDMIGTDMHEMRYAEALFAARYSPYMLKLGELKLLNDTL